MAASDKFEWYVSTQIQTPSTELLSFIKEERAYLLTLRSEDERQRFVEEAIAAINQLQESRA